jgi:hypothetical protein
MSPRSASWPCQCPPSRLFRAVIRHIRAHIRSSFVRTGRISSVSRGQTQRPAIYPLIERLVSVDGHGEPTYRTRLSKRYEASPYFRQMLYCLSLVWSLPALVVAVGTTHLVFSHRISRDTAYVVNWVQYPYPARSIISIPIFLFILLERYLSSLRSFAI